MNIYKYAARYAHFHGCFDYSVQDNVIALGFQDIPWDSWLITRLYDFHFTKLTHKHHPFLQALKVYFKTEEPISVIRRDDSWTAILGSKRTIIPMPDKTKVTFYLYATQYFIRSPEIVKEYMKGTIRPAYENFYPYKNCILYLDKVDIPYPGGCYFDTPPATLTTQSMYRICFLTSESFEHVLPITAEWKNRRDVHTVHYYSTDTQCSPKLVELNPAREVDCPSTSVVDHGRILKRQSDKRPRCLLQDILVSYHRKRNHNDNYLKNLGIVIDWPLMLTYDGNRLEQKNSKQCLTLVVNGHHPDKKIILVKEPFETLVEFDYVPSEIWTPVSFVSTILELPYDVDKVSIDSTVIGFVYQDSFFCFENPLLEGRATWLEQNNVDCLLNVTPLAIVHQDSRIHVIEVVKLNEQFTLNRVQFKDIPYTAWCITDANRDDPQRKPLRLSYLVQEWSDFFQRHYSDRKKLPLINADILKLALILARHNICFRIKINNKYSEKSEIAITDNDVIEITLAKEAVDFLNRIRVSDLSAEDEKLEMLMTSQDDWCAII